MIYDIKEISNKLLISEDEIYGKLRLRILKGMRVSKGGQYCLDEYWIDLLARSLDFRENFTEIKRYKRKKRRKFIVDLTDEEREKLESFLSKDIDKEELESHCLDLDSKLLNLRSELQERKKISSMNFLSRLVRSI